MKKYIIPFLLVLSSTLVISSCKDDDDNKITPTFEDSGFTTNGSMIKGTVSTLTTNQQAVSYDFEFKRLYQYPEYTTTLGVGSVRATLVSDLTGVSSNNHFAGITISGMQTLSQSQTPDISIQVASTKKMDDGKTFEGQSTHEGPNLKISNYKYDASTRTISADFIDTTSVGDNGQRVRINGSFKIVDIKEYVSRP